MDWIFSHLDDLESMDVSEGGRSEGASEASRDAPPGPRVRDGPGSESDLCVYMMFDQMIGWITCRKRNTLLVCNSPPATVHSPVHKYLDSD